jgi:UDP-N-acetylmuramate--alanine ligase
MDNPPAPLSYLGEMPPPPAHVHFIGAGGIGVSGLARILLARGYRVSGCDLAPGRVTESLAAAGAVIYQGHDPAHLDGVDLLVVSSAVRPDEREYAAARARGLRTVKRAALLGLLLRPFRTVAVAGTHGKTTTSALVAAILLDAGLDPTAFVGGEVPALGGNARDGRGAWAVVEADEYDRSFLQLAPAVAVVTNVEADHLDIYADLAGVMEAFAAFVALLPATGTLVACADDPRALEIAAGAPCRVVTYGLEGAADWSARDVALDEGGARFTLVAPGLAPLTVTTPLSGRHNVANTVAALAACAEAGVAPGGAVRALAAFETPRRRQEVKGRARGGALVVDDYAHHPTEVRATLAGLRARYPDRRLRVVYQPHTYTRTRATLGETGVSFADADEVAVAEVYAAREQETLGVGGRDVAAAVDAAGVRALFVPTLDDAAAWLSADDGPDVVLVTLGAGDIWKAGEKVVSD